MNGKHHFLPQFYLKEFCNSKQKLHVYNKKSGKYKEFSTAGIYYSKGLNDIVFKGNVEADLEKTIYNDIDDINSKNIARVMSIYNKDIDTLSLQDKQQIVIFVFTVDRLKSEKSISLYL